MKILLASDLYVPAVNGVVTSTKSLKKALEHLGHDVRILTLASHGYIDRENHVYAVSSVNVNKVYPGARVKVFMDRSIMRQLETWYPDIIHTQTEFSTFRMAKQMAEDLHIPIVHTYHTIYEDYTHYFSPTKKTGRKIVSSLTKRILSEVESVIVPTNKVYNILESYGVEQPIEVIPTGIQLENFQDRLSQEERVALRQQYQIPVDAFLLVSLGRLGKEKNVEEILSYLALIKQDVYFLIVGDGPHKENLMEKVASLGLENRVRFAGMVQPKAVASYYQMADLFVCASTSETQGLTYIEALASGLPALCRADDSIEDVVINGHTGYQYHHVKEFESCLYDLMLNKKRFHFMQQQAKELVTSHYSSEAFGLHVSAVYKKALVKYDSNLMLQMHP